MVHEGLRLPVVAPLREVLGDEGEDKAKEAAQVVLLEVSDGVVAAVRGSEGGE